MALDKSARGGDQDFVHRLMHMPGLHRFLDNRVQQSPEMLQTLLADDFKAGYAQEGVN